MPNVREEEAVKMKPESDDAWIGRHEIVFLSSGNCSLPQQSGHITLASYLVNKGYVYNKPIPRRDMSIVKFFFPFSSFLSR